MLKREEGLLFPKLKNFVRLGKKTSLVSKPVKRFPLKKEKNKNEKKRKMYSKNDETGIIRGENPTLVGSRLCK